jgi:hypothetical protein
MNDYLFLMEDIRPPSPILGEGWGEGEMMMRGILQASPGLGPPQPSDRTRAVVRVAGLPRKQANPKLETRNPKQMPNPDDPMSDPAFVAVRYYGGVGNPSLPPIPIVSG